VRGEAWLRALKPGDEVIVSAGGWSSRRYIHRVTKVTAQWGGTLYVGATAFDMRGRERSGNAYTRDYLHEPTPELREEATRQALVATIRKLAERERLEAMPTQTLKSIADLLAPKKAVTP